MLGNTFLSAMTMISYDRRVSVVTVILSSVAFILVITAIAVFIYVTRKEKILPRYHLISVIVMIFVELAFLIAVVLCFSIQSTNTQGQILAVLLIIISFFALMTLIYFLLEDILKERIKPMPDTILPSKSHTMQEIRTISRHDSPVTPSSPLPPIIPEAEPSVIPIPTPPVLTPVPRIPTPPMIPTSSSPTPPPVVPSSPLKSPSSSPMPPEQPQPSTPVESPSLEPTVAPTSSPLATSPVQPSPPIVEPTKTPSPLPPLPPPSVYLMSFEKIRQDLLAAIEERTIPALESAIQQVKDHDVIQQLKYECERALELLNRLMKIETMKYSRFPWRRIKVLRLNPSTIAELHSYIKPPDEVSTVMRATFLLLGHSEKEIQDWHQIQNLLGRFGKDSVRRRCYELNPLAIPVDKAREAKDILRNYDLIRVSEISVGLSAFYCWASAMIDEREKLLESQRRIYR